MPGSEIWVSGRNTKQRTDQKTIGQPIVQGKHGNRDNTDRLRVSKKQVSDRPGRQHASGIGELPIVDEAMGNNVEVHRGVYGHKRKDDCGVGYEPPLDGFPSAIDGIKQRCDALKKQHDDEP